MVGGELSLLGGFSIVLLSRKSDGMVDLEGGPTRPQSYTGEKPAN